MISNTFKDTFYFFRKNILHLLGYTFLMGIVLIILAQLLLPLLFSGHSAEEMDIETIKPFMQLMNLLVKPIYTGGIILLIYHLAMEQNNSILSCLLAALMRWPYMLIANLLTSIIVFVGLMFFVLPGIWAFSRIFLVPYLVILKNQTPFTAIINSYHYTQGYSFKILSDIILLIAIFVIILILLNTLHILSPLLALFSILLFQTFMYVLFYRHYDILVNTQSSKV